MMIETAYDYDNCVYVVQKAQGDNVVKFGFRCNCAKEILQNGGQQMLDELYAGNHTSSTINHIEYKVADAEKIADFDVTLGIDSSKLPKT